MHARCRERVEGRAARRSRPGDELAGRGTPSSAARTARAAVLRSSLARRSARRRATPRLRGLPERVVAVAAGRMLADDRSRRRDDAAHLRRRRLRRRRRAPRAPGPSRGCTCHARRSAACAGAGAMTHAAVTSAARIRYLIGNRLSKLRIHFVEVFLLDEHLARLAARRGRDEAVHLHHVDEPRRAAEADPQPALQVRDRRLAARDDDARGLVVAARPCRTRMLLRAALFVRGDRSCRRSACPACAGSSPAARSPVRRCTGRAAARTATRPAAGRACRPCRGAVRRRCRRGSCASRSSTSRGTRCAPACSP